MKHQLFKITVCSMLVSILSTIQVYSLEKTAETNTKDESPSAITINVGVLISTISAQGWRQTVIPDEWKGTVFDEIILLDEESFKIKQNGMSSLQSNQDIKTNMANSLKGKLQQVASRNNLVTLNVVFMGHSVLGGYLARTFAATPEAFDLDHIINQVTGGLVTVNFVCVTVGTPHQGVGLSAISVEPRAGFTNIAPTVETFRTEIEVGITEDVASSAALRYLFRGNGFLGSLRGTIFGGLYDVYCFFDPKWCRGNVNEPLDEFTQLGVHYLDAAFTDAQSLIGNKLSSISGLDVPDPLEATFDYGLKELLKPDLGDGDQGVLIDGLNALPDPTYYRNVFGAEKSPIPVRFTSEIAVLDIPYGRLFGLSFNDEQEFKESYGNAKFFAKTQKDTWWTKHQVTYILCQGLILGAKKSCNDKKDRHKRRSRNWGRTERALNNIDVTWANLINAYKYEQRSGYRTVYDPTVCEGSSNGPIMRNYMKEEDIDVLFRWDEQCEPYREEYYTYVVKIPLKNDGVTTPNHSTWNKNDNLYSENNNNFYYDDEDDKGFNHLELRRFKRLYTEGNAKKGDEAKPMREVKEWLEQEVIYLDN